MNLAAWFAPHVLFRHVEGLGKRLGTGREAGLEGVWVDQHEDPPEGVMRGNAVGQGQEGPQPAQLVATVEGDVVPARGSKPPGRPEEFHLQPPTEPCVNLSIYTARHCPAILR